MTDSGDDPLVLGLAAGDPRAFAELYDRFGRRLYRAALRMLDRPEDAEDAVQDVFTALVRSHKQLTGIRDLTAYLFAALRNAAGRSAERRSRQPVTSDSVTDAAETESPRNDNPHSNRLTQALRALPTEQREVVALKIDGELTFAQIAELLGISINTAASRYRYALEKLRASLQE